MLQFSISFIEFFGRKFGFRFHKCRYRIVQRLVCQHIFIIYFSCFRTLNFHIVSPITVFCFQRKFLFIVYHQFAELAFCCAEKIDSTLQSAIFFLEYKLAFLIPSSIDCISLITIIMSQYQATVFTIFDFKFDFILSKKCLHRTKCDYQ